MYVIEDISKGQVKKEDSEKGRQKAIRHSYSGKRQKGKNKEDVRRFYLMRLGKWPFLKNTP